MLAIIWLLTGYFGVFDLGLGRATAFSIAQADGEDSNRQSQIFRTSLWLNLAFGLIGAAVLYAVITPLFAYVFDVPTALSTELAPTLPWICLIVPLLTLEGVFSGALIGKQRFLALNTRSIAATALAQVIPLAAVWWIAPRLDVAIYATISARALGTAMIAAIAFGAIPSCREKRPSDVSLAKQLLSYGGWISLGRALTQLVASFDRFLIASMIGPTAVTHYSVPFQLVSRGSIVPNALGGALFPRLAAMEDEASRAMALRAIRANAAVMGVICCAGIVILPWFLEFWIDREFAERAALVGQLIALSVWLNAVALVPHNLLEAQGRPRETLIIALIQAVPFILLAIAGISWLGIVGVALARNARSLMDAVLLCSRTGMLGAVAWLTALPFALLVGAISLSLYSEMGEALRIGLGAVMSSAAILVASRLSPEATTLLLSSVRKIIPRQGNNTA